MAAGDGGRLGRAQKLWRDCWTVSCFESGLGVVEEDGVAVEDVDEDVVRGWGAGDRWA